MLKQTRTMERRERRLREHIKQREKAHTRAESRGRRLFLNYLAHPPFYWCRKLNKTKGDKKPLSLAHTRACDIYTRRADSWHFFLALDRFPSLSRRAGVKIRCARVRWMAHVWHCIMPRGGPRRWHVKTWEVCLCAWLYQMKQISRRYGRSRAFTINSCLMRFAHAQDNNAAWLFGNAAFRRRPAFESETRRAECAISFIRPPIVQGGVQLKRYYR